MLSLTVRVIQKGKIEFPNLSDASPTLALSNLGVEAKRQLVENKPLTHRPFLRLRGDISHNI